MIRNERGLTLIELLAVTVILSIVLGIVFLLMDTVFQTADDAHTSQSSQMNAAQTMHLLSQELSEAVAVFHPQLDELRFETVAEAHAYKAFVYEHPAFVLYQFNGSEQEFIDPTVSRQSHPDLYRVPRLLSEQLAAAPRYYSPQHDPLTYLHNGEFFTVELTFLKPVGPAQATQEDVHKLGIALFKER